jgi:hypothetical protein
VALAAKRKILATQGGEATTSTFLVQCLLQLVHPENTGFVFLKHSLLFSLPTFRFALEALALPS